MFCWIQVSYTYQILLQLLCYTTLQYRSDVQEASDKMIEIFMGESFCRMFSKPEKFGGILNAFALAFASRFPASMSCLQSVIENDQDGYLSNLAEVDTAMGRVAKVCRFIMCSFGASCSVEGFQEISSKDVVWLLSMKSNTMQDMEKSLKEIVTTTEEWKTICDEIVRTAQSSLALRPELERLIDSLKKPGTTSTAFKDMFKVVRDLKAGMRAMDLVEVDSLLLQKLRGIAGGVLKCSSAEAITKGFKSSDMDAIVEGLQLYQESTPGVADTIQSLKEWMTSQQKAMIHNDLLDIALRAHTRKDNRNAPLALLAPLALGRKII